MLESLPATDLFAVVPDIEGLDIWADSFSPQMVPAKPGVYCFYDADTKETLYIGSACSRSVEYHQRGLAMRLKFYRSTGTRSKSPSVRKILAEKTKRRILVRMWVAQSVGDARKYEYDAIEKHRPPLNWEMAIEIQSYEHRKRQCLLATKKKMAEYRARPRNELPPETTLKLCPDCKTEKPLSEFYKNSCRKDGHSSICGDCRRRQSKERSVRYSARSPAERPTITVKNCHRCKLDKPVSEFSIKRSLRDGLQRLCRTCYAIKRKKVQADPNSMSGKSEKAKKLGIPIISEAELYKMMKGTP